MTGNKLTPGSNMRWESSRMVLPEHREALLQHKGDQQPMPTNKKNRVVMLVDMQSFYANIEKSYDPTLKDKPVAVAGDPKIRSGVILAACLSLKNGALRQQKLCGKRR